MIYKIKLIKNNINTHWLFTMSVQLFRQGPGFCFTSNKTRWLNFTHKPTNKVVFIYSMPSIWSTVILGQKCTHFFFMFVKCPNVNPLTCGDNAKSYLSHLAMNIRWILDLAHVCAVVSELDLSNDDWCILTHDVTGPNDTLFEYALEGWIGLLLVVEHLRYEGKWEK